MHAVDATRLEETLLGSGDGGRQAGAVDGSRDGVGGGKKRVLFDRVVFNFPHTGKQRTHLNRNLIRDFFASTKWVGLFDETAVHSSSSVPRLFTQTSKHPTEIERLSLSLSFFGVYDTHTHTHTS